MYDVILVDGNAVGYSQHESLKTLSANGMQTGAIFGVLRVVAGLRLKYPQAQLHVLWDGKSKRRLAIHPGYKGDRESTPEKIASREAYAAQKPYIHKALGYLAVPQPHYADLEADDIAGHLVVKLKVRPEISILMVTGDVDWAQLIRKNADWYDPRSDLKLTVDNLLTQTGYKTPYQILEGKCLMGDSSDCIQGVGGIGKKGAPAFLAKWGSVTAYWKAVDSGQEVPRLKALTHLASPEGRAAFRRNLALMQLLNVPAPNPANKFKHACSLDTEQFQALCKELNFMSILKTFEKFVGCFEPKNG